MKRIYAAIAFLLVIVSTSLFTIKQCYDFRSRALPQLEQLSAYAQNQQLDQVAYVRFASVYREFQDIDSFLQELKKMQQEQLSH